MVKLSIDEGLLFDGAVRLFQVATVGKFTVIGMIEQRLVAVAQLILVIPNLRLSHSRGVDDKPAIIG